MESSSAPSSNRKFARLKRKGVRVVGKIRPLTESEKCCSSGNPSQISLSREENHVSVILHDQANGRRETYKLDGCYEQDESTSKLFALEVKPLLQGVFHGDNCCVISYGAQGSGKTQLIQGSVETPGLATMSFCEIISFTEEVGGSVAISCYEMYNDHIYDLLEHKQQEVQVMEDAKKAIQLKGLSKIPLKSLSDFEKYYLHISNQRKVPQKAANDVRVRKHKGLIMYVTSVDKDSKYSLVGKLKFMDLAAYEEVRKRADGKASLSECNKIDMSLYTLLKVVRALNENVPYIPYRETKLTRLLQDFLCGMNASVLITCLSPSLCPHTFRAISFSSSSCQFVSQERHEFARRNKECRRPFSSSLPPEKPHKLLIQKSDVSNVASISSALKEENSLPSRIEEPSMAKKDAFIPCHHIHESVDSNLVINMELSLSPEGYSLQNGQHNSYSESGKRSPTLTERLREISNSFKAMSSRSISLCTLKEEGSCSMQSTFDIVEPKTPRFPLSSKVDCSSIPVSFATPQEKFKTRSDGLKKSLANECLDFLNSASKEELKQLKGIGEKRASYILELRKETPEPFKEIDDLKGLGLSSKQIKGMMTKILADI